MIAFAGIFSIICSVLLPLALAVILCVRNKTLWKPLLFGALTFSVFQVLTRIPLLNFVFPHQAWFISLSAQKVPYSLFLGATAALFEEVGRYVVMALLLKKSRKAGDAIAFGVGHGGIEAVLVAMVGVIPMLITGSVPSSAGLIFASGAERLFTLVIQISLSVMVMKSVREKNLWWLLIPFAIHTIIDFGSVLLLSALGTWGVEGLLFAVALLMGWFSLKQLKTDFEKEV